MEEQSNPDVYLTLAGDVNQDMVKRVFQSFAIATQQQPGTVHLLLHSTGGFVGDGVGIYNFLRNLPLNIAIYNGGTVASIAAIVFLAARKRIASQTASFMIHKSLASPNAFASPHALKLLAESLESSDVLTESIFRQHLSLPPEKWDIHAKADLNITATDALAFGLIHEIGDFKPPAGAQVFNI